MKTKKEILEKFEDEKSYRNAYHLNKNYREELQSNAILMTLGWVLDKPVRFVDGKEIIKALKYYNTYLKKMVKKK
jgi:hypothetical protein